MGSLESSGPTIDRLLQFPYVFVWRFLKSETDKNMCQLPDYQRWTFLREHLLCGAIQWNRGSELSQ